MAFIPFDCLEALIMPEQIKLLFKELPVKMVVRYALLMVLVIVGLSYIREFTLPQNPEVFYAIGAVIFVVAGIIMGRQEREPQPVILPQALQTEQLTPLNTILSRREMEVLAELVLNTTNAEIAEKLFISDSTLKTHITRIYKKLGVKNRKELFAVMANYPGFSTSN